MPSVTPTTTTTTTTTTSPAIKPPSGCHKEENKNGEWNGGNCCRDKGPCAAGEGDCDYDYECLKGLKCGRNNCDRSLGFSNESDCCYDPNGNFFTNIRTYTQVLIHTEGITLVFSPVY